MNSKIDYSVIYRNWICRRPKFERKLYERMEALRDEMENRSSESQDQNAHMRDELYELRPFTFLSETRYRELKSRWGQVFRADMGAEAFYGYSAPVRSG